MSLFFFSKYDVFCSVYVSLTSNSSEALFCDFAFNLVCNNNILDILFVLSVVISTSVKLESEDKLPLISNFIVDAIPKNCNVVVYFSFLYLSCFILLRHSPVVMKSRAIETHVFAGTGRCGVEWSVCC